LQQFLGKLSDTEKKFFYITILAVLLAMFDRLFLGPVLNRLQTIDDSVEREKSGIAGDLRYLTYKNFILEQGKQNEKYLTQKVEDEDVVNANFLRTVERLANESKVNLVKSSPTESKKEKGYTDYFASVDCIGSFENVITFLYKINTSEDMLKVVKFALTPKRGAGDNVSISMSVVKRVVLADIPSDF
jgi:hypothetical protein